MHYVRLGSSGLKVSRICLGTMSFGNMYGWYIDKDASKEIIDCALDLGINFLDTANAYSHGRSEQIVSEVLRDRRDDIVIATKVYYPLSERPNDGGLSRAHILRQIDLSLERLQTDYVDLYQTHRWDYETPIEETLSVLNDLVHQGKTRYIGASSMHAWQFAKALWTSDKYGYERFVSMQNHYNLCYREEEREVIPLCKDQGIGLIPYSPLARGFLSGKYKRNETLDTVRYRTDEVLRTRYFRECDFDVLERALEVAREKGVTPVQLSIAWLLNKGVTAPILGVTKVEQVEEAVGAIDVQLTRDDMRRLEEPYQVHPIMGHT